MKTRVRILRALVLVTVISAAPYAGADDDVAPPPGTDAECGNSENPSWWEMGNVKVTCTFGCGKSNVLFVSAKSGDTEWGTPHVFGEAQCGGETIRCSGAGSCDAGPSDFTGHAGTGTCVAESNEFHSSYLEVECQSKPGDACEDLLGVCPVNSQASTATIRIVDGSAYGSTCQGNFCVPVRPYCQIGAIESIVCWIGDRSEAV